MEKIKEIVRLCETDIEGSKRIIQAIKKIKGVGHSFAYAVLKAINFDFNKKIGELNDKELEILEKAIKNPQDYGIPPYIYNRRKDIVSGKDLHIVGEELKIKEKQDIQREISIKSWRGIRHMQGLPVRGQRTRTSFRKGKTVGVIRKKK